MGFKVNASFLHFLTMGALASRRVMQSMAAAGLTPIELERYSTSNKLWTTKVKRLRLPDLLCVATGLRVEVRAKSDLAIRMSDAPANPQRRWFAGLAPDDMIALVHSKDTAEGFVLAQQPELFWVRDIQACSESHTRLGPPKSASEGSERDREWPSIVPKHSGLVLAITQTAIQTRLDSGRAQTYQRRNLHPYVRPGDKFVGETQFIAGLPARKAAFTEVVGKVWDPRSLIQGNDVDRYVAAKALAVVGNTSDFDRLYVLMTDHDARVALEAAGSLAKLGDRRGLDYLCAAVGTPREDYLRMEAVLLLSELRSTPLALAAVDELDRIANAANFAGNEVRQAAIWGLGKSGLMAYEKLLRFLDTEDENERLHAVTAMSADLPQSIVDLLASVFTDEAASGLKRASAAHVLTHMANPASAISRLVSLARVPNQAATWAKAVLGSMAPTITAEALAASGLAEVVRPVQILTGHQNWTKSESIQASLDFLQKQNLGS